MVAATPITSVPFDCVSRSALFQRDLFDYREMADRVEIHCDGELPKTAVRMMEDWSARPGGANGPRVGAGAACSPRAPSGAPCARRVRSAGGGGCSVATGARLPGADEADVDLGHGI